MAVHDGAEAQRARRLGAVIMLISPVFPTRSHPGAPVLGRAGFAKLAAVTRGSPAAAPRAIALGGMDAQRYRRLRLHGAQGWAAIDAWAERSMARNRTKQAICINDQKRN